MKSRRFRWRLVGRQMIARVGPLTIAVKVLGSARKGTKRWMVGEVFGQVHHNNQRSYVDSYEAIEAAEAIAVRLFAGAAMVMMARRPR